MVLEFVYLLMVEFLGMGDCVGIKLVFFPKSVCESADIAVAFEPRLGGWLGYLDFEFTVDRCPGFFDGVAKIVICDC